MRHSFVVRVLFEAMWRFKLKIIPGGTICITTGTLLNVEAELYPPASRCNFSCNLPCTRVPHDVWSSGFVTRERIVLGGRRVDEDGVVVGVDIEVADGRRLEEGVGREGPVIGGG